MSLGKPRDSIALTTVAISPRSSPLKTTHRCDPNSPPWLNRSCARGDSQSGSRICNAAYRGRRRYSCGIGATGTSWPPSSSSNSRTRGISSARNPARSTAGGPSGSSCSSPGSPPPPRASKPSIAASSSYVRSITGGVNPGPGSRRGSAEARLEDASARAVRAARRPAAASDSEIVPSAASSSHVTVSLHSSSSMSLNGYFSLGGGLGPGLTSSQSSSKNLSSYPVAAHSRSISRTQLFSGETTTLPSMSSTRPCSSLGNSRNSPTPPSSRSSGDEEDEDEDADASLPAAARVGATG
mmetsp:Transcript_12629/g.50719  ORF Transcript_12629/g.50719 Transcript_12629/m.50719 type:complete len:297 (-) Transcript_12629:188-1078(-)